MIYPCLLFLNMLQGFIIKLIKKTSTTTKEITLYNGKKTDMWKSLKLCNKSQN